MHCMSHILSQHDNGKLLYMIMGVCVWQCPFVYIQFSGWSLIYRLALSKCVHLQDMLKCVFHIDSSLHFPITGFVCDQLALKTLAEIGN